MLVLQYKIVGGVFFFENAKTFQLVLKTLMVRARSGITGIRSLLLYYDAMGRISVRLQANVVGNCSGSVRQSHRSHRTQPRRAAMKRSS